MSYSTDTVAAFCKRYLHRWDGHAIPFREVYSRFLESQEHDLRPQWSAIRFARVLRERYPVGSLAANISHVGNVSWTAWQPDDYVDRPYMEDIRTSPCGAKRHVLVPEHQETFSLAV